MDAKAVGDVMLLQTTGTHTAEQALGVLGGKVTTRGPCLSSCGLLQRAALACTQVQRRVAPGLVWEGEQEGGSLGVVAGGGGRRLRSEEAAPGRGRSTCGLSKMLYFHIVQ